MGWLIFLLGLLAGALLGAVVVVLFIASRVGGNPIDVNKTRFIDIW